MSTLPESTRTHTRRHAPSRTAGLICAVALAIAAAFVSTSFAQDAPPPPETPHPSETPAPPAADDDNPASPSAQRDPSKLDPFPVVVVAGRQGMRSTKVSELSVRGPRGARVVVRCLGKSCPMRRTAATIPRAKRLRIDKAERVYRAGLTLEVRVTGRDRVGKYTKIRFRRGRTPARSDACLQPGATRPSSCEEDSSVAASR